MLGLMQACFSVISFGGCRFVKDILGKVFIGSGLNLTAVLYQNGIDYYAFVKSHTEEGMRQVIITSEIMLLLIEECFILRKFEIVSIEFMVEDEELDAEINAILNRMANDRVYWGELKSKLEFLNEQASIDIKKIKLKGMAKNGRSFSMFFQVNGIFGISDFAYDEEKNYLLGLLKRWLI